MGQRSVPAPFLMKTYELVDDDETNDVISWGEDGITFIVWKIAEFAKDLLPKYFKHNNFSSFVRQLNTYGFRKIVPDKWEFANDNFKRDDKSLLTEIRRRKTTLAGKVVAGSVNNALQCVSGEDGGSTSTSSQGMVIEVADLSGENEKLRRDNEILSSELAQTKRQCDELTAFLTTRLNVGRDQVNQILRRGLVVNDDDDNDKDDDNDEENKGEIDGDGGVNKRKKIEEEGLKLFGVWLKEVDGIENGRKRGRCGDIQLYDGNSNSNSNSNNNNSNNSLVLNGPNYGRKFTRTR